MCATHRIGDNAMPFIPAPNSVRVTLEFTLEGEIVVNVYYVSIAAPIATANLTQIAEIFRDSWITAFSPFLSQDLILERVTSLDVSVDGGTQVVLTALLPETGGIAASAAPNNIALCVTKHTLFTGRSNRGRAYIAGIAASSITDNEVSSTVQAGLIAAHESLRTDLFDVPCNIAVVSYFTAGAPRATAQVRGIASFSANNRVDTQRRRLPN